MQYFYLSEIDVNFLNEEGKNGVRSTSLQKLEASLKEAMVNLKNAENHPAEVKAKNTSRIAELVAKHENAQLTAGRLRSSDIVQLRARVKRYRTWLERQGCKVLPDGSVDWNLDQAKVEYDHTLQQKGMTKLKVSGGRLKLDHNDKLLDTADMSTRFSGPGYGIYVMSAQGNIHVSSHSVGHRHHSSLLAGAKVACAGELQATAGRLTWLSNKSGHYAPKIAHLLQVLHMLQKNKVPMTFALKVLPDNKQYATVGTFLKSLDLDGRPDYEFMKLLAYAQHLDDDLLATHQPHSWRWCQNNEKPGVYSTVTNQQIPHNVVRKWLKSQGLKANTAVQPGTYVYDWKTNQLVSQRWDD